MNFSRLLLKAADTDELIGEHKVHFFEPQRRSYQQVIGRCSGLKPNRRTPYVYVEPGRDSTEYHKHYYEEECIYQAVEKLLRLQLRR